MFSLWVPSQNRTSSQSKYSQINQQILLLAIVDSTSVLEDPTTLSLPPQKSFGIAKLKTNSSCWQAEQIQGRQDTSLSLSLNFG